jgi:hypothetical protein
MNDLVIEYTPEQLEREFAHDSATPLPKKGGVAALARSIGAHAGLEIFSAESSAPDRLERDGSQFILISCALLERFGVPEDARDFALWMEGVADGKFGEPFRATDAQIASIYGYSERTVRDKRAALMRWQEGADATLVQVTEKQFNRETGRNDPTEYTVWFGQTVSRFIRLAREHKAFRRNPVRSIEQAEESGLMELVEEVKDDLNPNLSVRRKEKKEPKPPKEDRVVKASEYKRRVRSNVEKWADVEFEMGNDVEAEWEVVVRDLAQIVAGAPARYEAVEGDKRRGKKSTRK